MDEPIRRFYASFREGLIADHRDEFDLTRWARAHAGLVEFMSKKRSPEAMGG